MRTLKLGLRGDDVIRWETFLKGCYPKNSLIVDVLFDQPTHDLTCKFQSDNGLSPDGIVGSRTYGAAMRRGFNPGIEDDRTDIGPNWPPRPSNLTQISPLEREKIFGKFSFISMPGVDKHGNVINPEGIKITDDWVKNNITRVFIKQLIGVQGAPKSGIIDLHKKIANQYVKMFQAWDDAGLKKLILSFGGSWVPRYIRGSRTSLSNHSWGTAIDINVKWNPLGAQPALVNEIGSVRELAIIAYEFGQCWGGWFNSRPDGMHFETFKIIE